MGRGGILSDCKDLHKFIMGDVHVDGWKSDWRKAMEADFAARGVSGDSRPVKQARVKAVRVAKVERVRNPEVVPPKKLCTTCQKELRSNNKSGFCEKHYKAQRYVLEDGSFRTCGECGIKINRKNTFGMCRAHTMKHFDRRRRERLKVAA
jgi:hypothetical protein